MDLVLCATFSFRAVPSMRKHIRAVGGSALLEGFGLSLQIRRNVGRRPDDPHCRKYRRGDSEKWRDWDRGELFAVGFGGDVVFCLSGGTTVV